MTRKEALTDLLEKVEAGDERYPFSWVNEGYNTGSLFDSRDLVNRAHQGSLDAALALHEAVLPKGWAFAGLHEFSNQWVVRLIPGNIMSNADTPARAWLIAILKALIAQEDSA